jgi:hypothetical protein
MAKTNLRLGWDEYFKPTPTNVIIFFDSLSIFLTSLTVTFAESLFAVKVMLVLIGGFQFFSRYIGKKKAQLEPDKPNTDLEEPTNP